MKSVLIRTVLTLGAVFTTTLAQQPPAPLIPPTPSLAAADEIELQVQEQVAHAQAQVDRAMAQAHSGITLPEPQDAPAPPLPGTGRRVVAKMGRHAPAKALVIRTAATDSKTQANLEEDLSVMARILQKAAGRDASDEEDMKASGISLLFTPEGANPRTLYLEGYGALFLLNVGFPLLPPSANSGTAKTKPPTNSTWEEARRELYGSNEDWDVSKWLRIRPGHERPQPYDAKKVERLQRAVLEALKNGTNIRNLGPDETITVCVFGGASAGEVGVKNVDFSDEGTELGVENVVTTVAVAGSGDRTSGAGQQTVLTLRVKKADVDAFAKGDLDLDAFTHHAQITTYAAESGGWGGGRAALF
jgi:hypothetical protein